MRAHKLVLILAVLSCRPPGPRPPAAVTHPSIDALLGSLTTRQKVAQLVTPFLAGGYAAVDDSVFQLAARWVDSLEVGGIYISVGSPTDVASKLNLLQRRSPLPLLVSSDLEWGAGMRLSGATTFPHVMAAGATRDPDDAYAIARAAAIEGRAVGIHMNFAPDADLNNNPLNPVINTRSFGEDPAHVSRLVASYIAGLRDHGMISTLKHFPGHGDTEIDSHIGLPVIRADYRRLDSLELVPFRAGIAAGADVVMSAHIAFPSFTGNSDPGTLSAAVLTGLLRDTLGFRGLVVTDALSMGAIVSRYGAGEAAVRAFLAGSDILLMPADPDSAVAAMTVAVQSGRISSQRLDTSVRRVLELKQRLGLFERRVVPLDSIIYVVGRRDMQRQAEDIAVRSLTLVRDSTGVLARMRRARGRVAVIAYADELNSGAGQYLTLLLRLGGDTVNFFRLWPMSGPASYDSARAAVAREPRVIIAANVRPLSSRGTIAIPDDLARFILATDAAKPTVLVSLGSPYLLQQAPGVKSFLIAWSGARVSERAVALALQGRVPITGKLPVQLPPTYAVGHGITLDNTAAGP
jgi:beta-glucosidase-like glycosyl hydrolase